MITDRPGIPPLPTPYAEQAYKLVWNGSATPPSHEWQEIIVPIHEPDQDRNPIVIREFPSGRMFFVNKAGQAFGISPDPQPAQRAAALEAVLDAHPELEKPR